MMLSQKKEKSIVQRICSLARLQNEEALTKLVNAGVCLDVLEKGSNAVMLLAKEGNKKAVEFLMDTFKSNRNSVVRGYAQGGFVDLVNEQIEAGASPEYAVWGYAETGNVKQVNALIDKNARKHYAVLGYASIGYVDQVNQLTVGGQYEGYALKGYAYGGYEDQVSKIISISNKGWAVNGYACAGRFDQVNALLINGGPALLSDAVAGYAYSGYDKRVEELLSKGASVDAALAGYARSGRIAQADELDPSRYNRIALSEYAESCNIDQINKYVTTDDDKEAVLIAYTKMGFLKKMEEAMRLASLTDYPLLRWRMLLLASQSNPGYDVRKLDERATTLNKIMKDYHLSYKQAQALEIKGLRAWMLQGQSMVKDEKFPPELFLAIAASVGNLSGRDTLKVFSAVNRNLLFGAIDITVDKYKNNKMTIGQSVRRQKQIDKNYHRRMNFGFN